MEHIKRKVGYQDLGRTTNLVVTAVTLNFPLLLKQSFEDIGIYTDVENPVYEIIDLSGLWNPTNPLVVPAGTSNTGGNNGNSTITFSQRGGNFSQSSSDFSRSSGDMFSSDFSQNSSESSQRSGKPCLALNNCSATITSTPISYFGGNDGMINASISPGCPAPYTYSWTGPNEFTSNSLTLTGLKTGNYTLTITDGNCDFSYVSYYLQQPQGLYMNLQQQTSTTNSTVGCNGSANVTPSGGQPPYTYTWYSFIPPAYTATTVIAGPSSIITGLTGLCAGVYSVQVMDSTQVIVSNVFTITEPSNVSGSVVTIGYIDCNGGNTGTIVLEASGGVAPAGYTFNLTGPINTSNTTGTFSNLPAGTYNVTIYDGVGNFTTVGPISVIQPIGVTLSSSKTNVTCYGDSNGSILYTPGGGTPPYTLSVSENNNTLTTVNIYGPYNLTGLNAGSYTTIINDSKGCPGLSTSDIIQQRPNLTITTITLPNNNGYNIPCFGGTISQAVSVVYVSDATTISPWIPNIGLTYPMNFYVDNVLASTGNTLSSNVPLTAGTHVIRVEDSAGCSVETSVTVTQPDPLVIVDGIDYIQGVTGCVGCGPATCRQGVIDVTGGVGPYTIIWTMTPVIPGPDVNWGTGITSNRYCANEPLYEFLNVLVTDGNGCTVTSSITV